MSTAVAGKVLSGVEVASDDQVDIGGVSPASASAARAAASPSEAVVSPSPAMWRWRMPVRCDDPLVGRLDHAFEIGIRHDAAGQRGADAAHD